MSKKFSIAPLLVVPFIACGSSDSHTVTTVDSHLGSGSGSGSGSAVCHADTSYGAVTFGSATNYGEFDGSGFTGSADLRHQEYFDGKLNADATPDGFQLILWAGYGVFTGKDIATGTYQITGDDADNTSCGLCGQIYADEGSDGTATTFYMADSGTVTVTSITTNITGTLSNLTFKDVDFDSDGNQILLDDCVSAITSASFSAPLQAGSASNVAGKITINARPKFGSLTHRHR